MKSGSAKAAAYTMCRVVRMDRSPKQVVERKWLNLNSRKLKRQEKGLGIVESSEKNNLKITKTWHFLKSQTKFLSLYSYILIFKM